jgi:hypothetical protein
MLVENGLFSRRFWGIFVSSLRAGVIDSEEGLHLLKDKWKEDQELERRNESS